MTDLTQSMMVTGGLLMRVMSLLVLVALFSLSKRSGMTGYRTGMIVGDPKIMGRLHALRTNPGLAPQDFVNAAAAVAYPVTDLADLTERSHRFERHYTDTLVGALPAATDEYRRRSPAWNASNSFG